MGNTSKVKMLSYCAICLAVAFVLGQVRLFRMPQGGSVTACGMLFIALTGYWFGGAWGAAAGAAYGFLELFLDPYIIHPIQFVLDYPLAYIALGALPALVRNRRRGLYIGYLLGVAGRFACVFISGVVFFAELSPDGERLWIASILNSLVYNASYILPEAAITLILLSVPALRKGIERMRLIPEAHTPPQTPARP